MEAIDLINHQKREEHIARRREVNRLTKAVLNEKDRADEKEEKLRQKLETVKLADQEAAQEGQYNFFSSFNCHFRFFL